MFFKLFLTLLLIENAMAHKETPINPVQQTDYAHFLEVDVRSYWWNDDFLSLIFEKRHQVKDVKRALDVGCGIGHWTEKFAPYLHKNAEIHGVDLHQKWVDKAKQHLSNKPSTQKFHFQQGSAYKLPYPDEHFDFVTCQTLLMHLDQPKEAIKEMLRVLKKGGILMMNEANNYIHVVRSNTAQTELSLQEEANYFELYLTVEEGKRRSKEGFHNISSLLPTILDECHCKNIQAYRSDKAFFIVPPYDAPDQKAAIEFILSLTKAGCFYGFSPEDTKRFFMAVSDDEKKFEKLNRVSQKMNQLYIDQIESKTFKGMFAGELILVSAKKA